VTGPTSWQQNTPASFTVKLKGNQVAPVNIPLVGEVYWKNFTFNVSQFGPAFIPAGQNQVQLYASYSCGGTCPSFVYHSAEFRVTERLEVKGFWMSNSYRSLSIKGP
jgi:hypothetical protein